MRHSPKLSVLIVDDSKVYRKILRGVVEKMYGLEVIGEASDGYEALSVINKQPPDLVLLDVEMPRMDGLATLTRISRRYPDIGVIMVSGTNRKAADITMEALQNGALDFVSKPKTSGFEESREALRGALTPIIRLVASKRGKSSAVGTRSMPPRPVSRPVKPAPPPPPEPRKKIVPPTISLVLLGVSTGGPAALTKVIPLLPANFKAPILLVQHMPEGFTKSLANQLNNKSALQVMEAEDGQPAEPGTVLIAPGGKHMVVRANDRAFEVALDNSPPVNSCKPSVDVLFNSAAGVTRGWILTTIMTGMGNDGADGVRTLEKHYTYNLAQDEASCTVYGMPRAIVEGNLADEVLPLGRLAARITEIVQGRVRK